jgi:hypothetical protein
MGGLSKDSTSSDSSSSSNPGKKIASPAMGGGGGVNPTGVGGTNLPKASAYPAANALAKRVKAAKGMPPEGIAAELKAMGVKERNRFNKWAQAMGYD